MYISKLQASNFKSYRDSTEVEFKPGFNVITGQNSSGKTALLEALTLQQAPKRHRSVLTIPAPGVPPRKRAVRATLVLSGEELLRSLQRLRSTHLFPALNSNHTPETMRRRLEALVQQAELRLSIRFERRPNEEVWTAEGSSFFGYYEIVPNPANNLP